MNWNEKELVDFRIASLNWYRTFGRRFPWRNKSATNYQIVVSEILLQRTRAATVAKIYYLFFRRYPSWKSLAQAKEEELSTFIKPLGLWQRRSKMLIELSKEMIDKRGRFPKDRASIESLPNIGQYIANAIMLFCYNIPQPLLDTNMARVLERVFGPRVLADIRYDQDLQRLALELVNCHKSKALNWAILDLAATICLIKNPLCESCPLADMCSVAI